MGTIANAKVTHYYNCYNGDFIGCLHLSRVTVKEKTPVLAGDVVGITGNTGRSTGEHLHLTCKRSGISFNPSVMFEYIGGHK